VRSHAYAATNGGDDTRAYRLSSIERYGYYDRRLRDSCERYELDKPKKWLASVWHHEPSTARNCGRPRARCPKAVELATAELMEIAVH
jgi:hypothetical protein